MKIMAVICEYNPFHKGHEYQLKKHREALSADGIICLMSGNFVQRGAPAVFGKWSRAETAVRHGADLVLELPVVYAAQSAMRFARGAVTLLDALGCVDVLSFGSECGDLDKLKQVMDVISTPTFAHLVIYEMQQGNGFAASRSHVLKKHYPALDESLIQSPNNILALEYLCALENIKSNIVPKTLLRNHEFASASQIREKMEQNMDVSAFVPWINPDAKHYDKNAFDQIVSYHFRKETAASLRNIADVAEGLENRFLNLAKTTYGFDALADAVKSKRYTRTRICRMIVNTILGITDQDTEMSPQYARVLAFNETGTKILNKMASASHLPIITKTADAEKENADLLYMLKKDVLASDIYALLTDRKLSGSDYTTSPIYVK